MCHSNSIYRAVAPWALAVFLGAGILAIAVFGHLLDQHNQSVDANHRPGDNLIIRYEVAQIWLPQSLSELAERNTTKDAIRTHEELRRALERGHNEHVWYALTVRGHQTNAEFGDITFIRSPYSDQTNFAEFMDILAVAAGNPPADNAVDYSVASIDVLPEELLNREPRAVVRELLAPRLRSPR
jgi:hypothetical protein